jgi:hypothetical protein
LNRRPSPRPDVVLSYLSGPTVTVTVDEPLADGGRLYGDTMDDQSTSSWTAPQGGYVAPPEPVPTATAAVLPALSRSALLARIGLLGISAAALIAAAILVFGSTASPDRTLAAGTTNGTTSGSIDLLNGGGPGFRGGHMGFGGITITAVSGNNISLETADGWTRTITVDSGTTYSKSGATIALGDLKVGDEIGFRQTHETNGTWTIDSIVVVLPHAGGEVTKISGSTITVTQRDGTTATITVNAQTTYNVNGTSAKLADVKVGMFLVAEGTKNADGSITATQVRAADATFRGDHLGRGFGFGPDANGTNPDATASPSATGTAS